MIYLMPPPLWMINDDGDEAMREIDEAKAGLDLAAVTCHLVPLLVNGLLAQFDLSVEQIYS